MHSAPAFDRGFTTLAVISPHLDDGVFSCGDLIAKHPGSTVITVMGGGPSSWEALTPWDLSAGFAQGDDVIAKRRAEDRAALAELEARPVWLPFWDGQYGVTAPLVEIRAALASTLDTLKPDAALIPLGLWDRDHRLTYQAVLDLVPAFRDIAWFAYEEAIYRRFDDSGLLERLIELKRRGLKPARVRHQGGRASQEKRRAVSRYRSQIVALERPGHPGSGDVLLPESFWRLAPQQELP